MEQNQPTGETILQFSRQHQLATLINRPLNVILEGGLLRLAGVPMPAVTIDPDEIPLRVQDMVEAEQTLHKVLLPEFSLPASLTKELYEMLIVGHLLQGQWGGFGSYQQWLEISAQQLVTRVNYGLNLLAEDAFTEQLPPKIDRWMRDYAELANQLFSAISTYYQAQSAQRTQLLKAHVQVADPAWQSAGTLSQLAIRALRSSAGISAVLVGMRDEAYVADVLTELKRPIPVENRDGAWQRLALG